MSRAKNMRLLSRALAFAVLAGAAILPNALNAQVVPAIKGGGSQINVYGLYTLVKTDFNSTVDYPPKSPPPSWRKRCLRLEPGVFGAARIFAWADLSLVNPR